MSTSSRTSPPALAPRTLTAESFDAKAERPILGHEEAQLVSALRAGSEDAFAKLIDRHHASMVRVARAYVPSNAVAEEVVQETWEAVITQLDRFERRSAVKTWIFRILINRAKSRGERERRTLPFSSLEKGESSGPTVDPTLFQGPDGEYPGHWAEVPPAVGGSGAPAGVARAARGAARRLRAPIGAPTARGQPARCRGSAGV